jgi:hypothetical protein
LKLPRRNFLHLVVGAATLPAISRFAWAQAYPTRPVRIIAGYPPGGSACSAICTMSACTLLTTAAGVPTGANSPNQEMASKSGKPDSASVGSSEMIG